MVNLNINGEIIQVAEGTTILDAAKKAGIYIPTLCHHPALTPYGACRLCVVEVSRNGRASITTSCNMAAEDGMVIRTDTPEVQETRKTMADLILSRCPDVPKLQRLAVSVGLEQPSYPQEKEGEDCILCGLCVRACDEKAHNHVLGIVGRGTDRRVTAAFDAPSEKCKTCDQCIEYCPTGAITHLGGLEIGKAYYQKAKKWIRTRQAVQYGALLVFLALITSTFMGEQQVLPINIFSRLNPLQALTAMVGGRELIGLFIPALITVAVTLVFGRVWCGWFCPLGAVVELFGPKGRKIKWQGLRRLKYVVLFTVLLMAAFGSLAFLYFEPITILVRGLTAPLRPVVDYLRTENKEGFALPGLQWWWGALPFAAVLVLNLVERRFWCRYLCPLGALVGFLSKFSWTKRFVNQNSCIGCGDCAKECTMGAISPGRDFTSDPAECIMCMDCPSPCPKTAISFQRGDLLSWKNEYDPSRREALATLGLGALAVGMLTLDVGKVKAAKASVLRPPGAQTDDFLAKCIRCDQCIAGCPNHVLQPSLFEGGWDALWTPVLDPYKGYCDYDCNLCGQICPSGAIPSLSLEDKRKSVIGYAIINYEACVRCMDCLEQCPNECFYEVEVEGLRGVYPEADFSKCNGCGLCVYICPKREDYAIDVYAVNALPEQKYVTRKYTA
jgi:polyferredoxin/ferredoxin